MLFLEQELVHIQTNVICFHTVILFCYSRQSYLGYAQKKKINFCWLIYHYFLVTQLYFDAMYGTAASLLEIFLHPIWLVILQFQKLVILYVSLQM